MATEDSRSRKTWLVIGASRGIGKEFVDQLLQRGDKVLATVRRNPESFWPDKRDQCQMFTCEVTDESSIDQMAKSVVAVPNLTLDHIVVNAGVLHYPNRATEMSFDHFAFHMNTNTIGPIICAQRLLKTDVPIKNICFISSDSGSTAAFREQEDGFAAYAASKAALNMAMRHMAAELKRKGEKIAVIAVHPGEVETDMGTGVEIDWDIGVQLSPQESVAACIKVIESKTPEDTGTFWQWENRPYPW